MPDSLHPCISKYATKGKGTEWKLPGLVHVKDPEVSDLDMQGQRRARQNGLQQCSVWCICYSDPTLRCLNQAQSFTWVHVCFKFPDYCHPYCCTWQRHLKPYPTWELWTLIVRHWKLLGCSQYERDRNTESGKGREEEGGRRERKLEHPVMVK